MVSLLKILIDWWSPNWQSFFRSELEEMNLDEYNDTLQERLDNIHINECAVLVYTSGTVGQPKGAMLSHDSITWNSTIVGSRLDDIKHGSEVLVSYLPLSHIAAQLVDIHVSISYAATVYFADKDALRGTLVNTLREAQPTRFVAVPRVYEKIYEKMMEIGAKTTGFKRIVADWAKGGCFHFKFFFFARLSTRPLTLTLTILNRLIKLNISERYISKFSKV